MPRVIHFEINVDHPERAMQFYSEVFGWQIQKWEGPEDYWLITTGEESLPGINGGLMKRVNPAATTFITIGVESVEEFLAKITSQGGQAITPKMAIPGVGYHAYFQDPEGNTLGIFQEDTSAQ